MIRRRLQEIKRAPEGCLKAWLLYRPDAHPWWHYYSVSLIHLRPLPGQPWPKKEHADSTHEILILALDPEACPEPDSEKPEEFAYLRPANLVHQLRGLTDAAALSIFEAFIAALEQRLSPDTDHRVAQMVFLAQHTSKQN
jgi:hypothetical protein